MHKNGVRRNFKIHRLVAIHFIPNLENKPCVDHIIPIRNGGTDCVDNLRWCTHCENSNNEISKNNLSKSLKGKIFSEEHKQKLSESHSGENAYFFGKHLSEEHRKKLSKSKSGKNNPNYGKHLSEETKRKIAESNEGKSNKKIICITTNETFESMKQASEKYNTNYTSICLCCRRKRRYAGKHPVTGEKLEWMYLEDYLKGE